MFYLNKFLFCTNRIFNLFYIIFINACTLAILFVINRCFIDVYYYIVFNQQQLFRYLFVRNKNFGIIDI